MKLRGVTHKEELPSPVPKQREEDGRFKTTRHADPGTGDGKLPLQELALFHLAILVPYKKTKLIDVKASQHRAILALNLGRSNFGPAHPRYRQPCLPNYFS